MSRKGHGKYAYLGLGPMWVKANGKLSGPLRLYSIWSDIKKRVRRPLYYVKSRLGNGYLDLKLTICEEWLDFGAFFLWAMSHGYRDDLSIDRIDNLKGYCPENCRWATWSQQMKNRRMTEKMRAANRRNARLGGLAKAAKKRLATNH